jgi:hypothetical protein
VRPTSSAVSALLFAFAAASLMLAPAAMNPIAATIAARNSLEVCFVIFV